MAWWKGSRYWSCSGEGHAGDVFSNFHRTNDVKVILSSSPLKNDHLFKVWMWESSTKRLHCSDLSSGGRKKNDFNVAKTVVEEGKWAEGLLRCNS